MQETPQQLNQKRHDKNQANPEKAFEES